LLRLCRNNQHQLSNSEENLGLCSQTHRVGATSAVNGILVARPAVHVKGHKMAIDTQTEALRLVRAASGLDIDLEPLQGLWSVEQYLKLTSKTNHLIEFTDGMIEVLPMPTDKHQSISRMLFFALFAFIQQLGGTVFYAPLRVQIRTGKFREPDLVVLLQADDPRRQEAYWLGADLVVEVVSPDDPERDTQVKVADYAEAGIPEYWIVNPLNETITVLTLADNAYTTHGAFQRGDVATSALLADFSVPVADVFNAR
jgi:Uma2 family endonuclease